MMTTIRDDHTIIAQCTPQGSGAIALIRVSGPRAVQMTDVVARLHSKKKLQDLETHTIHYGEIVENNLVVDTVLFLLMKAPRTFTGEDVVEITCHNNQLIVYKIIRAFLHQGARVAEKGEFAKRAVMNDKLDLVQAEAIHDIITATSDDALKKSLSMLQGSFSSLISEIEEKVLHVIVYAEASFEFLDEEISFELQIKERLRLVQVDVTQVLATFDKRQYVTQGVRIALVGSVNAGKSSLFNALINRQRAIVTDIAGTTRDTIEAGVYNDGAFVTFVDTAGLRESQDVVEKIGIDRSFQEVTSSDLILMVFDATATYNQDELAVYQSIAQQYADKIIFVQNKIDAGSNVLPFLEQDQVVAISVAHKKNVDQLRMKIDEKINALMHVGQSPCLLNKRQYTLLLLLESELELIKSSIATRMDYEWLVILVNDAIAKLSELTGKTVTEDALNAIFREFCVGK